MSQDQVGRDQVRALAERITSRLSQTDKISTATPAAASAHKANTSDVSRELAALRTQLAEINGRLADIEAHLDSGERQESLLKVVPPSLSNSLPHRTHPDQYDYGRRGSMAAGRSDETGSTMRLSGTYIPVVAAHPSEERFGISEAVREIVDFFEREKICELEPGGKPCDHCAMCSTRGF